MVWKQDLAKLKQQLAPETPSPVPRPAPKPIPKPSGPAALDDEDAIFLSAMGLKPAGPRPVKPGAGEDAVPRQPAPEPPVQDSFQSAVKELRGLKPLAEGPLGQKPLQRPKSTTRKVAASEPPPLANVPIPLQTPALPEPPPSAPGAIPPSTQPTRFQLAAGMAIEVDGTLDLRGHTLSDAMERLKDRLGDGVVLGWRSLLVNLGPDPALHEGLLALLASGEAPMVARYAQAPVPMGGTQAWLLYFTPPPAQNA